MQTHSTANSAISDPSLERIATSLENALETKDAAAVQGRVAKLLLWTDNTNLKDVITAAAQAKRLNNALSVSLNFLNLSTQVMLNDLLEDLHGLERHLSKQEQARLTAQAEQDKTEAEAPSPALSKRKVLIVEDDSLMLKHMVFQFEAHGFHVVSQKNLDNLRAIILTEKPDTIVMDVMLREGISAGANFMAQLNKEEKLSIPTVFISARDDFEARLNAVRGGAMAYLCKPFDFSELLDVIDEISRPISPEPYKVMAVDDDSLILRFVRHVLEGAGFVVETTTEPSEAIEIMYDFRPEVLISDLNMPGCSGIELAGVVRQLKTFMSMPIVFLSAETDTDYTASTLYRGGDIFVNKPVDPSYLIDVVRSRAIRARAMRSMMFEDSLTGMLNHMTTRDHLRREIARAYRSNEDLTVAMVDIDHFKRVNDTYGHPTGDRVLKSFSRFLKTRLRRTDIMGRYGGEEFAIIMPGTNQETAKSLMDELRIAFGDVNHECDKDRFKVTFSCGLASFPPHMDMNQLIDKADLALYEAKDSGRNRIVTSI